MRCVSTAELHIQAGGPASERQLLRDLQWQGLYSAVWSIVLVTKFYVTDDIAKPVAASFHDEETMVTIHADLQPAGFYLQPVAPSHLKTPSGYVYTLPAPVYRIYRVTI